MAGTVDATRFRADASRSVRGSTEKSNIIYCTDWFMNEAVNAIEAGKLIS